MVRIQIRGSGMALDPLTLLRSKNRQILQRLTFVSIFVSTFLPFAYLENLSTCICNINQMRLRSRPHRGFRQKQRRKPLCFFKPV